LAGKRRIVVTTGEKFNRWTVIKEVARDKHKRRMILCRCECGTEKVVPLTYLRSGESKSCGCMKIEMFIRQNTKHGGSRTKLYKVWTSMKQRCLNEKCSVFEGYGGRGITICDEWLDYETFRKWAVSTGYKNGLTIERKDVNGNYEPGNCEWIPQSKQSMNTRSNRIINFNGKSQTLKEWSVETGINYDTLFGRLRKGWSIKRALTERVRAQCRNQRAIK
jgi:hypothetical protein